MIKTLIVASLFCFSANDCPRAELEQPCYGECGAFIDKNSNSICDIWEKYNENKLNLEVSKKKQKKIISISLIALILITISEIFFKKSNKIRLIWNWLLFISLIISTMSGFFLYFSILNEIRKSLYEIHLQISTFFFITSMYHTIKRFKCMIK